MLQPLVSTRNTNTGHFNFIESEFTVATIKSAEQEAPCRMAQQTGAPPSLPVWGDSREMPRGDVVFYGSSPQSVTEMVVEVRPDLEP